MALYANQTSGAGSACVREGIKGIGRGGRGQWAEWKEPVGRISRRSRLSPLEPQRRICLHGLRGGVARGDAERLWGGGGSRNALS